MPFKKCPLVPSTHSGPEQNWKNVTFLKVYDQQYDISHFFNALVYKNDKQKKWIPPRLTSITGCWQSEWATFWDEISRVTCPDSISRFSPNVYGTSTQNRHTATSVKDGINLLSATHKLLDAKRLSSSKKFLGFGPRFLRSLNTYENDLQSAWADSLCVRVQQVTDRY